jgi:hypothetical protein
MSLTTHLHLVSRLRLSGAIPPFSLCVFVVYTGQVYLLLCVSLRILIPHNGISHLNPQKGRIFTKFYLKNRLSSVCHKIRNHFIVFCSVLDMKMEPESALKY